METLQVLERLEEKILLLARKLELLKVENDRLSEENQRLTKDIENNNTAARNTGDDSVEEAFRKSRENDLVETGSEQIKAEIDKYIGQLDECMDALKQL